MRCTPLSSVIDYFFNQRVVTQNWPENPAPSLATVPSGIVHVLRPCTSGLWGVPHRVHEVGIW